MENLENTEVENPESGLNQHFNFGKLLKFTLPCIGMMVLTSVYSIVDGFISALISFIRTMVFQTGAVFVLPLIFGVTGIWLSVLAAEGLANFLSFGFLIGKRKTYSGL